MIRNINRLFNDTVGFINASPIEFFLEGERGKHITEARTLDGEWIFSTQESDATAKWLKEIGLVQLSLSDNDVLSGVGRIYSTLGKRGCVVVKLVHDFEERIRINNLLTLLYPGKKVTSSEVEHAYTLAKIAAAASRNDERYVL